MSQAQQPSQISEKQRQELEQFQSMWKLVFSQFLDHKMAVVGLFVIVLFLSIAISAPLISKITGYDPEDQNPLNRYAPIMTTVALPQDQKESKTFDFIATQNPEELQNFLQIATQQQLTLATTPEDALYEIGNKEMAEAMDILSKIDSPVAKQYSKLVAKFQRTHWLGTDELGRDVFIRLVYGTRVSMGVGLLVALSSALLGLLIGSFAGYYGGFIDSALMRVTDSLIALPILPIQIVIAAIDLNKVFERIPILQSFVTAGNETIYKLIFILVIFSWMQVARLVRGSILSLREREFILAAKTLGAKDSTIIFRHMFPNVIAPMLVSITLGVGSAILWEAALSFLGLGIQPPTPSWGNMLFNAQELLTESPLLAVIPGLLILLTVMSFNYLGDGLQDAIDPKAVRR